MTPPLAESSEQKKGFPSSSSKSFSKPQCVSRFGDLAQQANPSIEVDPSKADFLGPHLHDQPLYKRINYLHLTLLGLTPILAIYGVLTCEYHWQTLAWAVGYYLFSGLGITAGYHRLFAHRAYRATPGTEALLICMGSGAVEGSLKWWARDHRAHHRYVDSEKDPYPATRGFWHSHIGWMFVKQEPGKIGKVDISDLNSKWMVRFQHRHYGWFALIFGFVVPTLVAGLGWGDYRGGFFLAAVARLVFVHHSTFFVNSLAHWSGDSTYTDGHTAKNSVITALLTIGEGYHNFHHEFPSDYRNGVEWYQYDPTKWFIATLKMLGFAYDVKEFPKNEIAKGKLQMKAKNVQREAEKIYWGPDYDVLPRYTMQQVLENAQQGQKWVVFNGLVIDVEEFMEEHPGGKNMIKAELGKDITEKFWGGVYKHSNAAHNLIHTLRIGVVTDWENKKED